MSKNRKSKCFGQQSVNSRDMLGKAPLPPTVEDSFLGEQAFLVRSQGLFLLSPARLPVEGSLSRPDLPYQGCPRLWEASKGWTCSFVQSTLAGAQRQGRHVGIRAEIYSGMSSQEWNHIP